MSGLGRAGREAFKLGREETLAGADGRESGLLVEAAAAPIPGQDRAPDSRRLDRPAAWQPAVPDAGEIAS